MTDEIFWTIHREGNPLPRKVTVFAIPHTGFILSTEEYRRTFYACTEEQENRYARWLAGLLGADVPKWARP